MVQHSFITNLAACCVVLCADMWKSVVNSINLSEQQKLSIVQWKQLFMQKVRQSINPSIHQSMYICSNEIHRGIHARHSPNIT
jgi:hypothetical protein